MTGRSPSLHMPVRKAAGTEGKKQQIWADQVEPLLPTLCSGAGKQDRRKQSNVLCSTETHRVLSWSLKDQALKELKTQGSNHFTIFCHCVAPVTQGHLLCIKQI